MTIKYLETIRKMHNIVGDIRPEITAVIVFIVVVFIGDYFFLYSPLKTKYTTLQGQYRYFSDLADKEKQKLAQIIKEQKGYVKPSVESLENFMRSVNDVGRASGIIIRKMEPDDKERLNFSIELIADYYSFLKFISGLEALSIDIHNISVHPYQKMGVLPRHVIIFKFAPIKGGKTLQDKHAEELKRLVLNEKLRNPFQQFTNIGDKSPDYAPITDLTWINKLTSIGAVGGAREATIDRITLREGDSFPSGSERKVIRIDADRVYLLEKTSSGRNEEYFISFREKKKGANDKRE